MTAVVDSSRKSCQTSPRRQRETHKLQLLRGREAQRSGGSREEKGREKEGDTRAKSREATVILLHHDGAPSRQPLRLTSEWRTLGQHGLEYRYVLVPAWDRTVFFRAPDTMRSFGSKRKTVLLTHQRLFLLLSGAAHSQGHSQQKAQGARGDGHNYDS